MYIAIVSKFFVSGKGIEHKVFDDIESAKSWLHDRYSFYEDDSFTTIQTKIIEIETKDSLTNELIEAVDRIIDTPSLASISHGNSSPPKDAVKQNYLSWQNLHNVMNKIKGKL